MYLRAWVLAVIAAGAVFACGGDDDEGGSSTGGTGGATGGAAGGGSGGTAGSSGGSAGATGGTAGGGGGDAASCGDLGQTADCKACLASKCCKEVGDCSADKSCADFVTCARACPDPTDTNSTCMQACIAAHSGGLGNYNGAFLCMQNNCDAPCTYL